MEPINQHLSNHDKISIFEKWKTQKKQNRVLSSTG